MSRGLEIVGRRDGKLLLVFRLEADAVRGPGDAGVIVRTVLAGPIVDACRGPERGIRLTLRFFSAARRFFSAALTAPVVLVWIFA